MATSENIQFRDLTDREDFERVRLERCRSDLAAKSKKRGGILPPDEQNELDFLSKLKKLDVLKSLAESSSEERVEPLFVAVRDLFNEDPALIGGVSMYPAYMANFDKNGQLLLTGSYRDITFPEVVKISLVLGLMMADKVTPPRIKFDSGLFVAAKDKAATAKVTADEKAKRFESAKKKLEEAEAKTAKNTLEKADAAFQKAGTPQKSQEEANFNEARETYNAKEVELKKAAQNVQVAYTEARESSNAAETAEAAANRFYKLIADTSDKVYPAFVEAFYRAIGEAKKSESTKLAAAVLSILDDEGDPDGEEGESGKVECSEFARVIRCLVEKKVTTPVPQLHRSISQCLNKIQQVGDGQSLSDVGISLPDLNEVSNYQIQEENVRLMGLIICSAMFEELKVFQVLDKLVEQAQNGTLVTSRGKAGEMLYKYWKETPNRMSEGERSNLYALTLGTPGGDSSGMPNRDFNDLWLRFVSSVSSLVRQRTADQLLRSTLPAAISQQQVRKAARDLALNLSSRGYGMTLYLALELQSQIKMIIELLKDPEIMGLYGAKDMWQVIDQVATLELAGGARNTARYRTLATCGVTITAWLANNVKIYNRPSGMIIDTDEVLSIDPPTSSYATRTPTAYDLVNACELWLADTATSDNQIEQISQNPRESPMMTSRPVQIPAIAREMLDQAGIGVPGFGLGMGMRRQ